MGHFVNVNLLLKTTKFVYKRKVHSTFFSLFAGQTHYLLYGTGMQTWEYSPVYAIRSYAYLWLHALPACFHAKILQTNKVN